MPNIRMLQAHREMVEKEKLVHQGKVQARRRQETDTKDVADKTNKSEIARTIKKGEQDKRSAKNELDLATKKEANARAQQTVAAVGAVVGAAIGVMNMVSSMDKAVTQGKKNEADKLGKKNEALGDKNKALGDKNKALGSDNEKMKAENKAITDKGPVSKEDQKKIDSNNKQIGANEKQIGANEKQIGTNNTQIEANKTKIGEIKKDLIAGAEKGLLGRTADNLTNGAKDLANTATSAPGKAVDAVKSAVDSVMGGGAKSTPAGDTSTSAPKVESGGGATAKPATPTNSGDSPQKTGDVTNPTTKDTTGTETPTESKKTESRAAVGEYLTEGEKSDAGKDTRSKEDIMSEQKDLMKGLMFGGVKGEDGKEMTSEQIKVKMQQNMIAMGNKDEEAKQNTPAKLGMKGATEQMGEARGNLKALDNLSKAGGKLEGLGDEDKKKIASMGLEAGSDGKISEDSIKTAGLEQGASLAGAKKSFDDFSLKSSVPISGGLVNAFFGAKDLLSGGAKGKTESGYASLEKGDQDLIKSVIGEPSASEKTSQPASSGTTQTPQNNDSSGGTQPAGAKPQDPTAARLGKFVERSTPEGEAKQKFDALDPNVKKLIDDKKLTFDKKTGAISAESGGLFGVGGNTGAVINSFSDIDPKTGKSTINEAKAKATIEAIGKTDPAAAGQILSDIQQKDPVAFKAITAGMSDEEIGKAIGAAVDSGAISTDKGKAMLDSLDNKVTGSDGKIITRGEAVMDKIADSNVNAADKLFDAGAKTSNSALDKIIGGAKGQPEGSSSTPSAFNSALLLLNMAGPAIQMYLQALDKIREAQEQQLEAMKKYAAAKKMVDTLRGDLKRLEGDGQSGGGGMQGAQAGTGGAR